MKEYINYVAMKIRDFTKKSAEIILDEDCVLAFGLDAEQQRLALSIRSSINTRVPVCFVDEPFSPGDVCEYVGPYHDFQGTWEFVRYDKVSQNSRGADEIVILARHIDGPMVSKSLNIDGTGTFWSSSLKKINFSDAAKADAIIKELTKE